LVNCSSILKTNDSVIITGLTNIALPHLFWF
jgi:hypothetical protein